MVKEQDKLLEEQPVTAMCSVPHYTRARAIWIVRACVAIQ